MSAARLYLAELLGTFLFMTIGYASVANFGVLIAYILPGLLVLWGLSELSPAFRGWLAAAAPDTATIGGFLYITIAAIGAGLTASTVRT